MKNISLIFTIFAVSVLFVSVFGIQEAEASHFRFGHLNWEEDPNNPLTVTFGGNQAWREGSLGGSDSVGDLKQSGLLNFGDGSAPIYVEIEAVNLADDWMFGKIVDSSGNPITHTYPDEGPYTAGFSSCCRISGLQNTGQSSFTVETIVDLRNNNNQSPKSSIPPIVFVPANEPSATFLVPAIDSDGDSFTFRKSSSGESGISSQSFYSINGTNGQVTLSTVGKSIGTKWAASVTIEENKNPENGKVMVDFIIQVGSATVPPEFVEPTPIAGTEFEIAVGETLSFDLKCQDLEDNDTVTIAGLSLPEGSLLTPSSPTGTPSATGTFSWTPDSAQVVAMTFTCRDQNLGSAPLVPITIRVTGESENNNGGDNQWDTRPTFGISHEDRANQVVDSGFSFNGEFFTLTDNHHTDFAEQSVEIGTTNSFSAKVYADKKLKVQEFLFGIPNVGEAHLAELGVEVWYDRDGNIEDVVIVQETSVIDEGTVSVSHEKTKCLPTDPEPLCDTTTVSMTFLEPLADKVMAIKAIDYALRDQRTFLNEGFDISGESLNPMFTQMIPSNVKNQGLIQVTQLAKYSPYWQSADGRMFEMNSFGSFKEVNQSFERFQDSGDARTRLHSGFGGILQYEQNRATEVFDSTKIISDLPDSFGYHFEMTQRLNEDMMQKIYEQQEIANEILKEMEKQNRYY